MGRAKRTVYGELVEISRDYLGPAAERFVNRQISTHLDKAAADITTDDVRELLEWIKPAFSHITHDQSYVNSYTRELEALAESQLTNSSNNHVKLSSS